MTVMGARLVTWWVRLLLGAITFPSGVPVQALVPNSIQFCADGAEKTAGFGPSTWLLDAHVRDGNRVAGYWPLRRFSLACCRHLGSERVDGGTFFLSSPQPFHHHSSYRKSRTFEKQR